MHPSPGVALIRFLGPPSFVQGKAVSGVFCRVLLSLSPLGRWGDVLTLLQLVAPCLRVRGAGRLRGVA